MEGRAKDGGHCHKCYDRHTQLRHVRSFIIDGWLFSSLPLLHTCSPQWRVGFGRGPGQIAARQASSNLVVELQAQLLKPWRRAGGGVNDVALALLLDRRAAADTCSDKSDIRYMTKTIVQKFMAMATFIQSRFKHNVPSVLIL